MSDDYEPYPACPECGNRGLQRIWNDSAEGAVILPADPVRHHPLAISVLICWGADAYRSWLWERR